MKIGILTFHCAINYGAVLQAYGLQEYLKSVGHEVSIVDYRPNYLLAPYRIFKWKYRKNISFFANIRALIRECMVMPIRLIRKSKFHRFVKKYLSLYRWDANLNVFDVFIMGSDQIWNPHITCGLDKIFLGDFEEAKEKKMIAYAASAGCAQLSVNDFKQLAFHLKNFVQIGVRESALYKKISLINNNVSITIDPVLLAGKEIYSKIAADVKTEESYLLLFTLGRDENAVEIANKLAVEKNLRIVEIVSSRESLFNSCINQMLSPTEFLGYVKRADFVVTSSFHGTVFSILFHKPFVCVNNENLGISRFYSLLEMLGLENCLTDILKFNELELCEINWDLVDKILKEKQQEAEMFLKMALEKTSKIP